MAKAQTRTQTIAQNNFDTAIDQADAYGSLRASFEAYYGNVYDTAVEEGVDISQALEVYDALVRGRDEEVFQSMWTM